MWEMLCTNAKNLSVKFDIVEASENHIKVNWIATYDFSKTGRRVENRISTHMDIDNGKIVRQVDDFDFSRWARQAFGLAGYILGYIPAFHRKVQKGAREGLQKHLSSKTP